MTAALSYVTGFLKDINTATLSGAIDIIVIEQPDGSFRCTPFHVRFGKLKLIKAREKIVTVTVNGKQAPFVMKLGSAGEAYFVEETEDPVPHSESASPIPTTSNLTEELKKQQSISPPQIEVHVPEERVDVASVAVEAREGAVAVAVASASVGPASSSIPAPTGSLGARPASEPIPIQQTPTFSSPLAANGAGGSPAGSAGAGSAGALSAGVASGGGAVAEGGSPHRRPFEDGAFGSPPVIAGLSPELGTPPSFLTPPDSPAKPAKPGTAESRTWWTWRWGGLPVKRMDPAEPIGVAAAIAADVAAAAAADGPPPPPAAAAPEVPLDGLLASVSPPQGPQPAPPAEGPAAGPAGPGPPSAESDEEDEDELQFRIEMKDERPAPRPAEAPPAATPPVAVAPPAAPPPPSPPLPDVIRPVPVRPAPTPTGGRAGPPAAPPSFSSSSSSGASSGPPSPSAAPLEALAPTAASLPRLSPLPPASLPTAFTAPVPRRASASSSPEPLLSPRSEPSASTDSSPSSSGANGPAPPADPAASAPPAVPPIVPPIVPPLAVPDAGSHPAAAPVLPFEGGIELALCAHLLPPNAHAGTALALIPDFEATFEATRLDAGRLAADPSLAADPKLLCKIGDRLFPWSVASPLVMYWLAFRRQPPQEMLQRLCPQPLEKKPEEKKPVPSGRSWRWWWGRGGGAPAAHPAAGPKDHEAGWPLSPRSDRAEAPTSTPASPRGPRRETEAEEADEEAAAFAAGHDHASKLSPPSAPAPPQQQPPQRPTYQRKSLRPSPAQLKALGLRQGTNTIVFTVTSQLQGTQRVESTVYVWPWRTKVIVSDVDGTITRSDVLGHILPIVGKDWSHSGVTALYTNIMENGYNMMYLTSRAIGQANTTRGYLQGLKQGGLALPPGPVIMSPDRLFESLTREVIRRKPEEFKIAALRDVRGLFPEDHNPFYAGFGNRPTDVVSYRAVGVPEGKIFIINASGEIRVYNKAYVASYASLNRLYNEMFPPLKQAMAEEDESYNEWSYWRTPILPVAEVEGDIESGRPPPKEKEKERPEAARASAAGKARQSAA